MNLGLLNLQKIYLGNQEVSKIFLQNIEVFSSTAIDPYVNNVSLLMHMDGTSGSTIFTDSSINNLIFTRTGTPSINTTIKKFGTGSGYFDNSGDYLSLTSNSLFGFGTGDFTIEMWIYPTGNSSFQGFFNINNYTNGILMRWHANSVVDSLYINGTNYNWQPATYAPVNNWTHVALVRYSNNIKMFANGINRIGNVSNSSNIGSTAVPLIGASSHNTGEGFNGYIDEIRVTKGIARYVNDFTPPNAPFPNPV